MKVLDTNSQLGNKTSSFEAIQVFAANSIFTSSLSKEDLSGGSFRDLVGSESTNVLLRTKSQEEPQPMMHIALTHLLNNQDVVLFHQCDVNILIGEGKL